MKLWLIAIWKTIPPSWIVISAPFVLPLLALGIWFMAAGLFAKAINPTEVAYAEEVEQLMPRAVGGEIPAQLRIAAIQRDGLTGTVDGLAAFRWFEKAARKGSIPGQFGLGGLYAEGLGVRRDYVRAAEWYRAAGGLGRYPDAQYALGELYFYGRGVPHNYRNAEQWYQRAAAQGHPAAQFLLGAIYEKGWGVQADVVEAYAWYRLSAEDLDRLHRHLPDAVPNRELDRLEESLSRLQLRNATALFERRRGRGRKR